MGVLQLKLQQCLPSAVLLSMVTGHTHEMICDNIINNTVAGGARKYSLMTMVMMQLQQGDN
jgi:hypothetical protein